MCRKVSGVLTTAAELERELIYEETLDDGRSRDMLSSTSWISSEQSVGGP
jgi:hypothetical protein